MSDDPLEQEKIPEDIHQIDHAIRIYAKGISQYLQLKGLRCIKPAESNDDKNRTGDASDGEVKRSYDENAYYLMRPDEKIKVKTNQATIKDDAFLPPFSDILDSGITLFLINHVDDIQEYESYSIDVVEVDTDELNKQGENEGDYGYIDNYNILICAWNALPARSSSSYRVQEEVERFNVKEAKREGVLKKIEDPYLKDVPMDRSQFYQLVYQFQKKILKTQEKTPTREKNAKKIPETGSSTGIVGVTPLPDEDEEDAYVTFTGFTNMYSLDIQDLKESTFILKFDGAFWDFTEVMDWQYDYSTGNDTKDQGERDAQ